ncbi:MAG TPA: hypothetical protein VJA40_01545 [archaeon]|nr:hypothetical protein [archaeon]
MGGKNKAGNNDTSLAAAVLVLLLLAIWGGGFGYMGGAMFFGPVFMVLVLVLAVWLVVTLTKQE